MDNTLKLWKLKTHELVYSFKADEYVSNHQRISYARHNWHQGGVVCVDVHPKNSLIVTGARDGTVKLSNGKTHRV